VLLLAQLLSSPAMFPLTSQPDTDSLERLEDAIMRKTADVTKSSGPVKMLPLRLLHLLVCVLSKRALVSPPSHSMTWLVLMM
jgi:hypothetical protein